MHWCAWKNRGNLLDDGLIYTWIVLLLFSDGSLPTPGQPRVEDLRDRSAVLSWSSMAASPRFAVEICRLRPPSSSDWRVVRWDLREARCVLETLQAGETYFFRVFAHDESGRSSESGPTSQPLVLPATGDASSSTWTASNMLQKRDSSADLDPALWQRDFERRYIELEELGRGRFAVVRRCQEILSGEEVAVKFVNRHKQSREATRREFERMRRLRHSNIVEASGLFLTATSDAIVMSL